MSVRIAGPVVNGDVDHEDEVEQKDREEEEMEGRVEAGVVFQVLWGGHGVLSGLIADGPQHIIRVFSAHGFR